MALPEDPDKDTEEEMYDLATPFTHLYPPYIVQPEMNQRYNVVVLTDQR